MIYHAIHYNVWINHPLVNAMAVQRAPVIYGSFDEGTLDVISDEDRGRFRAAVRTVSRAYGGPALIDLEGPAWRKLRDPNASFTDWQASVRLYSWLVQEAYRIRPGARWGQWGLPNWYHGQAWWPHTLDTSMLALVQGAVFPNCYDVYAGAPDDWQVLVVHRALVDARGLVPVYPFISCRSYVPGWREGQPAPRLTAGEFQSNLDRIMAVSVDGRTVNGVVLWDATSHEAELATLDAWHAECLGLMLEL